jgi:hypothetical protein
MSEHDAHLSLTDTVRIIREDALRPADPLETTQRMTPYQKMEARRRGWALHFRAQEAVRTGPDSIETPDFRDNRPRGHLDEHQKRIQDLRTGDDE